jgi:predicted secreted hydrolase
MKRRLRLLLAGGALAALGGVVLAGWWFLDHPSAPRQSKALRLQLAQVLGGEDSAGFARATRLREFRFPADHGPHPDYRSEWWYLTGNLADAAGRRFGYQWTLFRFALRPRAPHRRSAWATRDIYLGHLAVTDVARGAFHAFERISRGALGLAGAQARPFRAWIDGWSLSAQQTPGVWQVQGTAAQGTRLALRLKPVKPVVLQGDHGLSRKSATPGNASYYYSLPRLATSGTLTLDGVAYAVTGTSWLDREWSTSALEADQSGWDWFGLQLDDDTELMYYRLRRDGSGIDPYSSGVFVDPRGEAHALGPDDVGVEVRQTWQSPHGARYPIRWHLSIPGMALEIDAAALVPDQELDLALRYWEGAVRLSGTRAGRPVGGYGYVELTGYD